MAYAKRNGLHLAADADYTFFDKGRSGFYGEHLADGGELKRFLDLVEDGSIAPGSYLLCESPDRFSRGEPISAANLLWSLTKKGIKVVILEPEKVYDETSTLFDFIGLLFEFARSHGESQAKSFKVSQAWQNKQKKARESKTPLGKVCPAWLAFEDSKYILRPDRVEIVRRIFRLTCDGYGAGRIVRLLNAENVPVFGSQSRNKSGIWGLSTITKILGNRAVLGEYQPFKSEGKGRRQPIGEPIKDFYPQIISEQLFYEAAAARKVRLVARVTNQSKNFNIFQKIIFCSRCGSPLHKVNKGTPPKGYEYLVCGYSIRGGCQYQALRIDTSETLFKEILVKVDSLALVRSNKSKLIGQLQALEGKISGSKELIARQMEVMKKFPSDEVGQIIQESKSELIKFEADHQEVLQAIATDKIINRDAFLQQIDLGSYEGRYRANQLLIRLGVRVSVLMHNLKWLKSQALEGSVISLGRSPKRDEWRSILAALHSGVCILSVKGVETFTFGIHLDGRISPRALDAEGKELSKAQGDAQLPEHVEFANSVVSKVFEDGGSMDVLEERVKKLAGSQHDIFMQKEQ